MSLFWARNKYQECEKILYCDIPSSKIAGAHQNRGNNQEINIIRSSLLFGACGIAMMLGAFPSSAWSDSRAGVSVACGESAPVLLTAADLAKLPEVTVSVSFGTDHGQFHGIFSGPLLWTVLNQAKAIDPKNPRLVLREFVLVTGADRYSAVLALGEIAPEFEDKDVILATQMNGQELAPGHFRIVVPGDKRGGRSVRDVVRMVVSQAGPKQP
jgi:hypothetical protein